MATGRRTKDPVPVRKARLMPESGYPDKLAALAEAWSQVGQVKESVAQAEARLSPKRIEFDLASSGPSSLSRTPSSESAERASTRRTLHDLAGKDNALKGNYPLVNAGSVFGGFEPLEGNGNGKAVLAGFPEEEPFTIQRKVARKGGVVEEGKRSGLREVVDDGMKSLRGRSGKSMGPGCLAKLRRVVSKQRGGSNLNSDRLDPSQSRRLHIDSDPVIPKSDQMGRPITRKVASAPKVVSYPGFTTSAKPSGSLPSAKRVLNDGKAIMKSRQQDLKKRVQPYSESPRKRVAIAPTSWKSGQAVVNKLLRKPSAAKKVVERPGREDFEKLVCSSDEEVSEASGRETVDVGGLSESGRGIIEDLKMDEEGKDEEAVRRKRSAKGQRPAARVTKPLSRKKRPVIPPFEKPIGEKARHYDAKEVQKYMTKKLAERRRKELSDKKVKEEKDFKKKQRLQSLFDYQKRHVQACLPKYSRTPGKFSRMERYDHFQLEGSDSDKENSEIEVHSIGSVLRSSTESRPLRSHLHLHEETDDEPEFEPEREPEHGLADYDQERISLSPIPASATFSPNSARVQALKESALTLTANIENEMKRFAEAGLLKKTLPGGFSLDGGVTAQSVEGSREDPLIFSSLESVAPESLGVSGRASPLALASLESVSSGERQTRESSPGYLKAIGNERQQPDYDNPLTFHPATLSSYIPEKKTSVLQPWEKKGGDKYSVINIYARKQAFVQPTPKQEEKPDEETDQEPAASTTQSLLADLLPAEDSSPQQQLDTFILVRDSPTLTVSEQSRSQSSGSPPPTPTANLKFSPGALSHQMAVELHQLDVLEEGMRQAAALEKTQAVSSAHEETVTLARMLRGRQEEYQREMDSLAMKAREEMISAEKQLIEDRKRADEEVRVLTERVEKTRSEASELALAAAKMNENAALKALRASEVVDEARFQSAERLIEAARDQASEAHRLAVSTATAAASAAVEKVLQQHEERMKARREERLVSERTLTVEDSLLSEEKSSLRQVEDERRSGVSSVGSYGVVTASALSALSGGRLSGSMLQGGVSMESVNTEELIDESESLPEESESRRSGDLGRVMSVSELDTMEVDTATDVASVEEDLEEEEAEPLPSQGSNKISKHSPVTHESYSLQFEDSNVTSLDNEAVQLASEASEEERSFLMVLPSESHRRHHTEAAEKQKRRRSLVKSVDDVTSASQQSSIVSSPFSGDESFENFTGRMVKQLLQDEELRAQHQRALLKLREKALHEKSKAELEWLRHKEERLQNRGEDDKMPPLKERQRKVLSRLAAKKAEIRRLMKANKVATYERKQLLLQQKEVLKIKKEKQIYLSKLKQERSTPSKLQSSSSASRRLSALDLESLDQSAVAEDDYSEDAVGDDGLEEQAVMPSAASLSAASSQLSIQQVSSSVRNVSPQLVTSLASSTQRSPSLGRPVTATFGSSSESLIVAPLPSEVTSPPSATDPGSSSHGASVMKILRKLQVQSSEKYLTKREQKLMRKRQEAETILKGQKELLEWKERLDREEAEVKRILSEAMEIKTQRQLKAAKMKKEATYTDTFISETAKSAASLTETSQLASPSAVQGSLLEMEYSETFEAADVTPSSQTDVVASLQPSPDETDKMELSVLSESASGDHMDIEKRIKLLKDELKRRKAEAEKLERERKKQKEMALKTVEARLEAKLKNVEKVIQSRKAKISEPVIPPTPDSESEPADDQQTVSKESDESKVDQAADESDLITTPARHELSTYSTFTTNGAVEESLQSPEVVIASPSPSEVRESPPEYESPPTSSTPLKSLKSHDIYSETFEEPSTVNQESYTSPQSLDVGARVLVDGNRAGVVRFVGGTDFAPGVWAGVELDASLGSHDGCWKGRRYFQCAPSRGVLVPAEKVDVVGGSGALKSDEADRTGSGRSSPERTFIASYSGDFESEATEKEEEVVKPIEDQSVDEVHGSGEVRLPLPLSVSSIDDIASFSIGSASLPEELAASLCEGRGDVTPLAEDDPELDRIFSSAVEAVESLAHSMAISPPPADAVPLPSEPSSAIEAKIDVQAQESLDVSVDRITKNLLDESLTVMLEVKLESQRRAEEKKKTGVDYDVAIRQLTDLMVAEAVKEMRPLVKERQRRALLKKRVVSDAISASLPLSPPLSPKKARDIPFPPLDLSPFTDDSPDSSMEGRVLSPETEDKFPVVVHSEAQQSFSVAAVEYKVPFNRPAVDGMVEEVLASVRAPNVAEIADVDESAFRELVMDVARETREEIAPEKKPEVARPTWMKQRRCHGSDLRRMKAAVQARNPEQMLKLVQNEVACLIGIDCVKRGPASRKGTFSKAVSGRPVGFEAVLAGELKEEESQWIDYDEDEQEVKFQVADSILDMLVEETVTVVQGVENDKLARRQLQQQRWV
eukprot:m.23079 g.23079  ORF g.23079 m.23079 type:complete len:2400 (+) comp28437_c0_seq1:88-7287(+)